MFKKITTSLLLIMMVMACSRYVAPPFTDVDKISKLKTELYNIISAHSGQPFEQVEKDSDRDHWMTAAEAQAYGMVDEVLGRNPKKA
jgi:ATP-dependent protease ClpP protease subunit